MDDAGDRPVIRQSSPRAMTIPYALAEGIAEIDTRDLAALLADSNPWMKGDSGFWLSMAAGIKDRIDRARPSQTSALVGAEGTGDD